MRAMKRVVGSLMLYAVASGAMAAQVVVPTDFATIGEAIAAVTGNGESNTIIVEPGTWAVNLSLISNLTLRGREASRTILIPVDTTQAALISGTAIDSVRVSNFTFRGDSAGILINSATNVRVSNNIFRLGTAATAVTTSFSTVGIAVENNTFYRNGTAILRDSTLVTVTNNLFNGNTLAISPAVPANVTWNGFFANTDDGTQGTNQLTGTDPKFVDTAAGDFHLLQSSPAIDEGSLAITDAVDGTRSDLGAYGGTDADAVPFPVANLHITAVTTGPASVTLAWNRNGEYHVTNSVTPGSYRLYYGPTTAFGGTEAGASPLNVGDVNTFTLNNLDSAPKPAAPTGLTATPANHTLQLRWSPVPAATGYRIRYGIAAANEHQLDVGNVTSADVTGLVNGTTYHVTVAALARRIEYMAVSAVDNTAGAHESVKSPTVSTPVGTPTESDPSAEITDFPEPIQPQPTLPNSGCFIATAAFGWYDAAQVQALRDFRDRYLMTNVPGRAFVAWYYRHSPPAAHWLNRNAAWKPAVRVVLGPVVWISEILTGRRSPWPSFGAMLAVIVALRLRVRARGEAMA